jgi:hypothetical protein
MNSPFILGRVLRPSLGRDFCHIVWNSLYANVLELDPGLINSHYLM